MSHGDVTAGSRCERFTPRRASNARRRPLSEIYAEVRAE